ncbi:MAG: hypothetical protein N2319_08755 [Candidatus Kapabacteria bacterium]|nr:hypothetical protein [Candidatus Kapabacteria bacterium]
MLIGNSYSLSRPAENSGGGSCSASFLFGISSCSCTGPCNEGLSCCCETGFFSTSCACETIGKCGDNTAPSRDIPQLSSQQRNDAGAFAQWASQHQSLNIQNLVPLLNNTLYAIDNEDQDGYSDYENQFANVWRNLSSSDKNDINDWCINYNY